MAIKDVLFLSHLLVW